MAYMNKEKKAALAPKIKEICKKYGLRATLAVEHYSGLALNIWEGPINFFDSVKADGHRDGEEYKNLAKEAGYISVNPYWLDEHWTGTALDFFKEIIPAMNEGNHDRSDIMTDYFDVGWYIYVNVGKWDKPYKLEA